MCLDLVFKKILGVAWSLCSRQSIRGLCSEEILSINANICPLAVFERTGFLPNTLVCGRCFLSTLPRWNWERQIVNPAALYLAAF